MKQVTESLARQPLYQCADLKGKLYHSWDPWIPDKPGEPA